MLREPAFVAEDEEADAAEVLKLAPVALDAAAVMVPVVIVSAVTVPVPDAEEVDEAEPPVEEEDDDVAELNAVPVAVTDVSSVQVVSTTTVVTSEESVAVA
jgi:hypothetical protein